MAEEGLGGLCEVSFRISLSGKALMKHLIAYLNVYMGGKSFVCIK